MTRLLLAPSRSRVGAHRIRCCGPAELGLIARIGVAACGRIGFDAAGDGVVAVGYAEDDARESSRSTKLQLKVNNLQIEIRYVFVITSS